MDFRDVLVEGYNRPRDLLTRSLNGLTAEQLMYRPDENANSIAWLAWHLTRVQDHHMSDLAGRQQAWLEDGWHAKFGKPAEATDTGQRYSAEIYRDTNKFAGMAFENLVVRPGEVRDLGAICPKRLTEKE